MPIASTISQVSSYVTSLLRSGSPTSGIQEIISQIMDAGGVSRTNRFSVQIVPPRIVSNVASNSLSPQAQQNIQGYAQLQGQSPQSLGIVQDYFTIMGLSASNSPDRLDIMCCRVELPGKQFSATDAKTYGAIFQMPNVDVYSNITLYFIIGRDMFERDFFDAWSYTIQDPSSSDFNYVNEYATTVDILQMDEYNNSNYGVRLFQAWPINIGELKLEYADMNSYHVLPVTFTYRKWINLKVNTGTPTSIQPRGAPPTPFRNTISVSK